MSRTQYIFVDYENVQDVDLALVAGKPVVVELVLGEQHKNLPLPLVDRLMEYRDQIKLVKAGKSGRNALDFVLAYRVGVTTTADPKGYFHIVSRDTGFDALIAHLRKHGILARRDETFAKAFETDPPPDPTPDRPKIVLERWRKITTSKRAKRRSRSSRRLTPTSAKNSPPRNWKPSSKA